ncbi:gliding motility-associated C-terminal domain-containing protein [Olleya aquimaris]|uniref:Gliding motility-associated-like protein n=1 Tax=Olleya aquimaris TaxID=639310 RepID=A0A327RQH5_9FLAO|nr:gliding motility-associated C-terminal domain-containing protein [Olleya aquimaris]RAJ18212.1 gliding motility-associated-like protein [Olleya aquimaris]
MKTKSLFGKVAVAITYLIVFLSGISNTYAQCPTITDSNPIVCDASGLIFDDLNIYATSSNGIIWYDQPTNGNPFNGSQLVNEGTYYADDNTGSCGVRNSITVSFQVPPTGQNLDAIFCDNENATIQTYIDQELQSHIPIGGSVAVYYDVNLTSQANSTDVIPLGATNYFIVFIDSSGCESQIEPGSTAVFSAPADPTPADPQEFCSDTNPTVGDLDPGTTGSFSWYQNINGSGDPILPALPNGTPLINGNTYYVQVNDLFCNSNTVPVTVIINDPVDPGMSNTLEYCEDSIPTSDFNLYDVLGGTPDTTGSWSGPLPTTGGHLGTVNISTLTAPGDYVFTYTVPSTGVCPDGVSTVTITIYPVLSSGVPSAANPATFCVADLPAAYDLFLLLDNEDPNGQWSQNGTNLTSPADLTGLTPGTYDFIYTQNLAPNPCPEESTTVQVVVLQDPEAGNAINQVFCENDLAANSPFDLFNALDGTQDNNNGVWTDAANVVVSNPIDISTFTVAGSPYSFTYTIDNGTCMDSETITITVEPAPESGTPVATFPEFCEGEAPSNFDLFDLLDNEDQTGTWYLGTDNTGSTIANPVDLSGYTDGTYNFTFDVDAIGSCDDVLVTVQVTINPLPNTGVPTPATFCENDLAANSPLDLLGQLSGQDAGGTWTDDNATGALSGTNVDLTILTIGSYNFSYTITDANGCTNSSTVVITVEEAPESGNALMPVEFCENEVAANSPFDLFSLLDGTQDNNGTWYVGSDTSGSVATNPVDISGLTTGTYDYTYSVPIIGSCSDVDVTVQIIINPIPNTGVPTPATFCENDLAANSPLDLLGQLSGQDAGGTWTDDDATGALSGTDVDLTLLTIGSYNFTYTITANGCTNSSTVVITVEDAPESGTVNAPAEFCLADITTGQTFNLFDLLTDEDQTGTWTDDDATGALTANTVALDALSTGTFNFTFDVDAIGTCDDVLVTVSIIINDTPAPTVNANQSFCDNATVADLTATGNSIQWYDDATGGVALADTTVLVDGENYFASQIDPVTGCESSTRSEVIVTINPTPNPGNPATTPISVCNDNNAVDLNTGLDGTQDTGGVWQDDDATGALSGNILDATGLTAGSYNFTYLVTATAPCIDQSTTITITVSEPLNAGTDAILDVCDDSGTTDLFTLLGTADTGGTWSPTLTSGTGVFDPLLDAEGTYTYSLINACGIDSADVIVTVTQAPNAGLDGSFDICVVDIDTTNSTLDLLTVLQGTPDATGTFVNNDGAAGFSGTQLDLTAVAVGTYTFTYSVTAMSPCTTDATSIATVTVNDSPSVTIIDANPEFCSSENPTIADLNASVSGTNIVWYEDANSTTPLDATDALPLGTEDYFATQSTGSGCESSVRIQVNATVNDVPTPTLIDPNQELCINDAPTINDLTLNISEYDSTLNNVIWYDAATGGSAYNSTALLIVGSTYFAVLVDASTGCESSVRLQVTPDLTGCGLLVIPDGFSPNGDGTNDTFDIDNVNILYPNFEIEIFNRYGNIVYKGNASTPRFDGRSNQSGSMNQEELPVGVYFYVFNFNDGINKPKQGRLYLSR